MDDKKAYDHVWSGSWEEVAAAGQLMGTLSKNVGVWDKKEVNSFKAKNKISLCDFLQNHEEDIALEVNDFGSLKYVFNFMFGRDASVDNG